MNLTTNPKSVPGAIVEYSITVSNSGQGEADVNTFQIDDEIPANASLVVSGLACGGAVEIDEGSPASGLSCGTVEFSTDGIDYGYSPTASGPNNVDASVRHIRIRPNNAFNATTTSTTPNVTFRFRVELN